MQLVPLGSAEGNFKKGKEYCRKAKEMGADIALFPEMWSNGYSVDKVYNRFENNELETDAIPAGSEEIQSFADLARELDMAIGITFLEKFDPRPKNSLIVFDRHGKAVLHYSKVHTCDFGPEYALTPGNDFCVADLDTKSGKIRIGAMICYDREFPESARILMLKGAELILVPNACYLDEYRLNQLKIRSFENECAIAMTNYPEPEANGHSVAFNGLANSPCFPENPMCCMEADESEGIFIAEFNIDALREERKHGIWGASYRRPSAYRALIDAEPPEEFLRSRNRR